MRLVTFGLSLLAATAGCAPPAGVEPQSATIQVLTDPTGARVVQGFDRSSRGLGQAPVTIKRQRNDSLGTADEIVIRVFARDSSECTQTRLLRYDDPTPDTIRFDMHHCIPPPRDFSHVFELDQVTEPPALRLHPPLEYPDQLQRFGIEGQVVAEVVIDTSGRVDPASFRVVAATDSGFIPAVRQTLVMSHFSAGTFEGRRVRVRIRVPFSFTICTERWRRPDFPMTSMQPLPACLRTRH